MLAQLTPPQVFDAVAVRVNGPRCCGEPLTIDVAPTDVAVRYRLTLRNGVLTDTAAVQSEPADLTLSLPSSALFAPLDGVSDPQALAEAGIGLDGDAEVLGRLIAALDDPDPGFAIVTPWSGSVCGGFVTWRDAG